MTFSMQPVMANLSGSVWEDSVKVIIRSVRVELDDNKNSVCVAASFVKSSGSTIFSISVLISFSGIVFSAALTASAFLQSFECGNG